MEAFFRKFTQEEAALREVIDTIPNSNLTEDEKKAAIEKGAASLSQLSNDVKDAASFIPAHDQRTYSQAIASMTKRLQEVRTVSAPKRRFTFKKSTIAPTAGPDSPGGAPDAPNEVREVYTGGSLKPAPIAQTSFFEKEEKLPGFKLSSLTSTHYVLDASPSESMSMASITDIEGSVINISIPPATKASFATLVITNIEGSLLLCGAISGSAHITGVKDSTILITARQIRIHDCKNCVFYLHSSSRPIIEDCREIRFAPLPASMETDGSKWSSNLWDQVDDFKWLRAEPSPNWNILRCDDDRAVSDESWKEIIGGDSSAEAADLLELAKLLR